MFVYASLLDHEFNLEGTQALVEGIVKNLEISLNTSINEYLTSIKVLFPDYEVKYGTNSNISQSKSFETAPARYENAAMRLIWNPKAPVGGVQVMVTLHKMHYKNGLSFEGY